MSYAMSRAEREQFLELPYMGVMSVMENGTPLTVPIWYAYQPGGAVTLITGKDSRKTRAVRESGWLSLCAQEPAWPYKYVTAAGPAAIARHASHAEQREMAGRYLGEEGADSYMAWITDSGEVDEQVVIEMTPRTWLSVDYGKPG
jgi:nitroimidazol reductase NimA-like FMN-containing flavoprotein (pyridoxamine 5'-phosphate oxidase superfamily)